MTTEEPQIIDDDGTIPWENVIRKSGRANALRALTPGKVIVVEASVKEQRAFASHSHQLGIRVQTRTIDGKLYVRLRPDLAAYLAARGPKP